LPLRHSILVVLFSLFGPQLRTGRELTEVEVTDSHTAEVFLQSLTVHKSVLGASDAAAPANVTEGVHSRLLQGVKERLFRGAVDADGDESGEAADRFFVLTCH
jgi:hypothetical protein